MLRILSLWKESQMATSMAAASQTSAVGQMIRVRFATNRNQTGDDELFGSDFRNAPDGSLFVTGSIDVYDRGGSPHPNWVPDPKSLRLDPTPTAALSSIPQAVAAGRSTSDAMIAFIEDRLQAEAEKGKSLGNSGIVFLFQQHVHQRNELLCADRLSLWSKRCVLLLLAVSGRIWIKPIFDGSKQCIRVWQRDRAFSQRSILQIAQHCEIETPQPTYCMSFYGEPSAWRRHTEHLYLRS